MIAKKDSVWVKALEAKYCRNSNFLTAPNIRGASWIWKSLLQVRDIISAGLCWGIRGEEDTNLWCDPWVLSIPNFVPLLKSGTIVSRNVNLVKDLMTEGTRSWNVQLIQNLFEPSSVEAVLNISFPPIQVQIHPCGSTIAEIT